MVTRTRGATGVAIAALALIAAGCGEQPVDDQALAVAVREARPAEVTVQGRVVDAPTSVASHERFHLDAGGGLVVEIDHNTDLAPAVPVTPGVTITLHGQFEPDPGHPVIHYTHHATGGHEGGWIELNGHRYE